MEPHNSPLRILCMLGCSALCSLTPERSNSEPVTITNGNAVIVVEPSFSQPSGLVGWTTDGVADLYEQNWHLRIGSGRELALTSMILDSIEQPATNQIHLSYVMGGRGPLLSADATYTLTGGALNSGTSTVDQAVTLTNLNPSTALSIDLFSYADFDLPGYETNVASGGTSEISQTTLNGARTAIAGFFSPFPDAFQISEAGNVQTLRESLGDFSPTELANGTSPFGPADVDFASQWKLEIPAGGSVTVFQSQSVAGDVPEPVLGDLMQWEAAQGGNNHYYQAILVPGGVSWSDAAAEARARGGYLATPTSQAENDFVFQLVDDSSYWRGGFGPYLGGFQPSSSNEPGGGWQWLNDEGGFGDEVSGAYANWLRGEPNNANETGENILHYFASGASRPLPFWNDLSDSYTPLPIAYVVEWNSAAEIIPEPPSLIVAAALAAMATLRGRRRTSHRESVS